MRNARGYTLIEILVVLFIISIVTSVALLTISRNQNKQLETFANQLAQTMALAEEQAMLQSVVLGLRLDDHSFHFASLQQAIEGEKKAGWSPLQDTILGQHPIPSDIQLAVQVGGQKIVSDHNTKLVPQVVISTSGEITPFTIYIGKKGEKPRYTISGDADGNITNKALS
jgi:general secretion pathway protein H